MPANPAIFSRRKTPSDSLVPCHNRKPTTDFQKTRRGKKETLLRNHQAASHPSHLVEVLSHIPNGGNRKIIPDHLQPKSGFHNSYSRLASDKPAVAIHSHARPDCPLSRS